MGNTRQISPSGMAGIGLGLLWAAGAAGGAVIHGDSAFADGDWSIDHQHSTGLVFGGPAGSQVGGGGHPGEFRRVEQNDFTNILQAWHMRAGALYDPAVSGPIEQIDFAVDVRALENLFGVNVGVSLAVEQAGVFYFGGYFLNNEANWVSFSTTLHESDFNTEAPPIAHPDFSASGPPLRFGLVFSNDNTGVRATRAVGVDNWRVEIRPVCPADFNHDGFVNPDDLSDFITCFFLDVQSPGSCPAADQNADGFRNPDDLSDFITLFFSASC
jgi:hypothetical protein